MELNEVVNRVLKHISYDTYLEMEKRASMVEKFRFEKYYYEKTCCVCGKSTWRIDWIDECNDMICSSCARKVARAVLISCSMKRVKNKEYSRGVRRGYNLATKNEQRRPISFGEETIMFVKMIVEDAKKEGKTVHFLGRDMDVIFLLFNLEDNVNYLAGWNRSFVEKYNNTQDKRRFIARNNVQDGDYVIDTGFVGSIINDIRDYASVKGYLLSANQGNQYTYLYDGSNYYYRDWVCEIEHLDRARKVVINDETFLPEETYVKPAWFENGVFHGFTHGINSLKL